MTLPALYSPQATVQLPVAIDYPAALLLQDELPKCLRRRK